MSRPIIFYRVAGTFSAFSNFSPHSAMLDSKVWPTPEHYFQAQKFSSSRERERVRRANSAHVAARMGRNRKTKIKRNWDSIRVTVMRRAVRAKFQQHEDIACLLLSTGNAKLIEHTERDSFWRMAETAVAAICWAGY